MVEKKFDCKWSGFRMLSKIWTNGNYFVKNYLKSGQKHPDFDWSSFWMVGTIAIAKARPFENWTIWKSPDFEWFKFKLKLVESFLYVLCKNMKYANVFVFTKTPKYAYVCWLRIYAEIRPYLLYINTLCLNFQALFNDLNLFPSKSQVFEMVRCARESTLIVNDGTGSGQCGQLTEHS